MYKVIKHFVDLQDNHEYNVGDVFPHSDKAKVSAKRYEELATDKNRRGEALIVEIEEPKPKPKKEDKENKEN
jgi:hypothetical protein